MFITSIESGWANIIRFTSNDEDNADGSRIPAFFMYGDLKQLVLNHKIKGFFATVGSDKYLTLNEWVTVELEQKQVDGKVQVNRNTEFIKHY